MPLVRPAAAADLPAIARIYGTAVRTSVATFDLTDPPNSYWKHKISSNVSGDHVLVVEDGPDVVGYAYSGAFRSRPAYAQTRETSVYLAPEAVGAGLGTLLYSQLLSLLRTDGIHLVVAVIAQPNSVSVALHEKLGSSWSAPCERSVASSIGGSIHVGTSWPSNGSRPPAAACMAPCEAPRAATIMCVSGWPSTDTPWSTAIPAAMMTL